MAISFTSFLVTMAGKSNRVHCTKTVNVDKGKRPS